MKIVLFFLFLFSITDISAQTIQDSVAEHYFFCISRTIPDEKSTEIIQVVYTDIFTISPDSTSLQNKSLDWQRFMYRNCHRTSRCSSDLNYYPSREVAEKRLQTMLERYSDPKKYNQQKVIFR